MERDDIRPATLFVFGQCFFHAMDRDFWEILVGVLGKSWLVMAGAQLIMNLLCFHITVGHSETLREV